MHTEGHGRPEATLPGGLVEVLTRWEESGGGWRVLSIKDDWIDIALLSGDTGEQVTHVGSARTSVLTGFLAGRTESGQTVD